MAVKVPFQYLDGVAEPARSQLWRDFEEIQRALEFTAPPATPTAGQQVTPGLELYHPAATPYIDFHRAASPAGDAGADYNVRLINSGSGELTMHGTVFKLNSMQIAGTAGRNYFKDSEKSDGAGLRVGAAWGKYGVYSEAGDLVLGATTGKVTFGGTGDGVAWLDSGGIRTGPAKMSGYNWDGAWANFGHKDRMDVNSASYAFMHHSGGDTIVNSTGVLYLRRNGVGGSNECRLDSSGLYVSDDIAIPSDRAIYFKGPWDATHIIHHSSADDGLRYSTWNYHRFWCTGAERFRIQSGDGAYLYSGWYRTHGDSGLYNQTRAQGIQFTPDGVRTYPNGMRFDAYLFDHLGAWTAVPIWTRSDGGGSGARITHRAAGQNAAPMWKAWGQAFEARSWDDGAFIPIRGVIENYCRAESKTSIRAAAERLPKAQRKQKVKRLRTVHYSREKRGQGCANCLGTGLATKNERIKSWLEMKENHRKDSRPDREQHGKGKLPPEVEAVTEPVEGEACPDCGGQGMTWERPENARAEEAGWFGFIAEEIVEQFPEAMFYRQDEDGEVRVSGADHMALIAILWEEVKDLEERLDGVEKTPAVALGKK